jgi:hypothetical protein
MTEQEREAAIAAFIRQKGVTRCPTACAVPTQASIAAADRQALSRRAEERERTSRSGVSATLHCTASAAPVSVTGRLRDETVRP